MTWMLELTLLNTNNSSQRPQQGVAMLSRFEIFCYQIVSIWFLQQVVLLKSSRFRKASLIRFSPKKQLDD